MLPADRTLKVAGLTTRGPTVLVGRSSVLVGRNHPVGSMGHQVAWRMQPENSSGWKRPGSTKRARHSRHP